MNILREVVKKAFRLTIRGGRSATLALTVSKCENFDPFFSMEYDSMVLKTHFYHIVRGLKNAFLMPLTPLLYRYLTVLWQSSSGSKKELGILVVVKCSFFWRLPLPFLSNGHRGTLFSTLFFLSDGWKYNSAVCERAPLACFLTLPNWAESAQTDFNSFLILKHTLVV